MFFIYFYFIFVKLINAIPPTNEFVGFLARFCDWIDDYCDLTLDVIIKKLGKEANVLDVEKVKENIDKI